MKTLKALSALLTYPTAELVEAVGDIRAVLAAAAVLGPTAQAALHPLLDELEADDLFDLQERYILLFDRNRSLSLHLFEHVHGEGRDRGQAMVDLKSVYGQAGLEIAATELPDFVPLFLEYCSLRPGREARALLAEPCHIFTALAERLADKRSTYAAVFKALVEIAATEPTREALAALVADDGFDPNDLEALDAVWEEEEVRFGPGAAAADCGIDSLKAKVRQARRPAPGLEPMASGSRTVFSYVTSPRAAEERP